MAKRRTSKRKSEAKPVENDENHEETIDVENGVDEEPKTPKNKKKKSTSTPKATTKSKTPKGKQTPKSKSDENNESTDEEDYEVEKIIDVNYKSNKREFLIRWKNYSSKHDTWEPEENLSCDDLIKNFLELQEKRDKVPRKELREKPKTTSRFSLSASGNRKSKRTAGKAKNYTEEEDE